MTSTKDVKCVPMNCRGMELLGFSSKATVYFCVHQLAVELWRSYDTPRVSIQKKIQDLRIRLEACTKLQIRVLREYGIIDNFRATMIMLEDAERLFDALEHSRKKRGLLKHALKAKNDPSQRALRSEEQRAVKLGQRVRPMTTRLVCEEPRRINQEYNQEITRCALNGTHHGSTKTRPSRTRWYWDTLDVVDDVEEARDVCNEYEHSIEVISNTIQVAGEADIQSSCVEIERMEHCLKPEILDALKLEKNCKSTTHSEPIQSPTYSDNQSLKSSSHHSIRSPGFESSEFDEQASCYSMGKNSSPGQLSSTPDRFLFIDCDSESSSEDSGSNSDVFIVESPPSNHNLTSPPPTITSPGGKDSSPQVKRVIATKLRHFAKNTSPHSHKRLHVEPGSLIVSIPFSFMLHPLSPGLKQRVFTKPTALSSFAMKKRACSHTPSSSSDTSISSGSESEYELPCTRRKVNTSQSLHVQSSHAQLSIGLRSRGKTMPNAQNSPPLSHPSIVTRSSIQKASTHLHSKASTHEADSTLNNAQSIQNAAPSTPSGNTGVEDNLKTRSSINTIFTGNLAPPRMPVTARVILRNSMDSSSSGMLHAPLDDDQLSLSSYTSSSNSSNSTNASSSYSNAHHHVHHRIQGAVNGVRVARRNGTNKKSLSSNHPSNRLKSTISFEDLFNFYPPKLVMTNGELQPEQSLSIKQLERQGLTTLPQTHPFFRWSLGQPVRGVGKVLKKRKV